MKIIFFFLLTKFYFDIKHLNGRENSVADALSIKSHCLYEITFGQVKTSFIEKINNVVSGHPKHQVLCQQVK